MRLLFLTVLLLNLGLMSCASNAQSRFVGDRVVAHMRTNPQPQNLSLSADIEAVPVEGRYCRGPKTALVTIVEFGDLQCGHCAHIQESLFALEQLHPGEVRFCYRARPIPFHFNARDAAEALYAAGAQGRFWAMHDLLFAQQGALEQQNLVDYAALLGLDVDRFNRERMSEAVFAMVDQDESLGVDLKVKMLPTLFINGRRLKGAQSIQQLQNTFALARADAITIRQSGVADKNIYRVLYLWALEQQNKVLGETRSPLSGK